MTPHNQAKKGDIAEKILLPGDPLRAKFVAENFLEDVTQFNTTRNMFGYTGTYKGEKVSVMGTGMGIPSLGIYVHELIHEYGVKKLIRIGSCGAYSEKLKLYDIIFALGACTNSNFAVQYNLQGTFSAVCSYPLLERAAEVAKAEGIDFHAGNILSSDIFYNADPTAWKKWADMGVLAVEMETYGLYTLAAAAGVEALTILTVSDSLVTGEETSAEEREKSFSRMMKIALEV